MNTATHIVYYSDARSPSSLVGLNKPDLQFSLMKLAHIDRCSWRMVYALAGQLSANYLRLRYGSESTRLLLITENKALASILWVVPAEVIRRPYSFVKNDCAAIISCMTHVDYRGRGLYPAGIQYILQTAAFKGFFIWAEENNKASLRGIEKTECVRIGSFELTRWFNGIYRRVTYQEPD